MCLYFMKILTGTVCWSLLYPFFCMIILGFLNYLQEMLSQVKTICGTNTVARGTNKAKPTKSDTFRIQLTQLVQSLQSTNPW